MKKYKPFLCAILGFLFSKCYLLPNMYPLGIALLCVTFMSKEFFFLFVGALLGAITINMEISYLLVNALPYSVALPLLLILRYYRKENLIFKISVAAISFLLPVFFLDGEFFTTITLIFSALFSICLVPLVKRLYMTFLEMEARLSFEEADILSLCVIGTLVVSSLPDFTFLGFNLPIFALLFTSSLSLCAFETKGSIWATLAGIIYLLKGGNVTSALCLISGGVLGGIFSKKRGGILLGFVLGDLLISLFTLNTLNLSLGIINLLLGCLYTVFLKESFLHRLKRFAGQESGINDIEMSYIEGLRDKQKNTIENWARMYLELSKAFKKASRGGDFKKAIVSDALKICEKCKKQQYCLNNRRSDTLIELNEAAETLIEYENISALPLTLTARCVQPINLIMGLNDSYKVQDNFIEENADHEISLQLKSISDTLFALADEVSTLPQFDKEKENQVKNVLSARVGDVKHVSCRKKGESHILNIGVKENNKNIKTKIISALEDGFLGKYQCLNGGSDLKGGFFGTFAPVPRFNIDACALRENKKGQKVCGDSFSFLDIENDRYIAAISDGAGSGIRAKKESESTLDLLETFAETHISRKEMFTAMNRLLLLKGEKEDYSTVDVTEFDLEKGVMYWTKIGAVPGYILKNGKVEKIETTALPMGIVTKIEPVTTKKLVGENDVIVLVSDGVYDGLNVGNEDRISDILICSKDETPKKMAENILSAAKKTHIDDDMTVMVLKVKVA